MLESDQDRLDLLKALGEVVQLSNKSIYAIFENAFSEIDFDSVAVSSTEPVATVRSSDIVDAVVGEVLNRSEKFYSVEDIQPDGEGMSQLRLSEL